MLFFSEPVRRRVLPLLIVIAALVVLPAVATAADRRASQRDDRLVDSRVGERVSVSAATRSAQRRLRRRLGRGAVLRLDPVTGTPRLVTDLDGALSRRGGARPVTVALDFLRRQRAAFGLDSADLQALKAEKEYRSREGVTYVRLRSHFRGVPAFDGSTTAVVRDGRLLSLAGAPQPDLEVPSVRPAIEAAQARRIGYREAGVAGAPTRGRRPELVIFGSPDGPRLAWALLVFADRQHVYRSVVDAASGQVLRRANLVKNAGTGSALDYFPGAPAGGTNVAKPFGTYIDSGNDRLRGNFSWTYSDDADDRYTGLTPGGEPTPLPAASDEVPPSSGSGTAGATWTDPRDTEAAGATPGRSCPAALCTWNGFPTLRGAHVHVREQQLAAQP